MKHSKSGLFLVLLLFFSFAVHAQEDTTQLPLAKFQYDISIQAGQLFKSTYASYEGSEEVLRSAKNHNRSVQLRAMYNLGPKLRLGSGVMFGQYSFNTLINIPQADFPFLDKDFINNWELGFFQELWCHSYFGLPVHMSYNVLPAEQKHQFWIEGGTNLLFPLLSHNSLSYSSSSYRLFEMDYPQSSEFSMHSQLHFGLNYRYRLKNYHEIAVGLSTSLSFSPYWSGTYMLFPDLPNYRYRGVVSFNFSQINLNLGYSINPRRLAARKANFKQKKRKNITVPGNLANKHELRIGANNFFVSWMDINQHEGSVRPEMVHKESYFLSSKIQYLKYVNPNLAWTLGVEPSFGNYMFIIDMTEFIDPDVNQLKTAQVHYNNSKVNAFIGANQSFRIHNRHYVELGVELAASVGLSNTEGAGFHYYGICTDGVNHLLYRNWMSDYKRILPEIGADVAYVYENKKRNKWIVGAHLGYALAQRYTVNYEVMTEMNQYTEGHINIIPLTFNTFIKFSFTGKKRRYLQENF